MKTVSFKNIKLGGFWADRAEINRTVTLPTVYKRFLESGRFDAFKCDWHEGSDAPKPHYFWDSDVAKWIEAASYILCFHPDPELEKIVDSTVDLIEKNQSENGYFNIYFTAVEPDKRFAVRDWHELYCAGHLLEAALAYNEATGKDKFLRIMIKYIDLIEKVFKIEHSAQFDTPGHEEIELALVKLYNFTKDEKYLNLSKYFVDTRGKGEKDAAQNNWAGPDYYQSDIPVREFTHAEGHSVRAMYLYCAMADLAGITGDKELFDACERVFDNTAYRQMYITGGIGSASRGERFTEDYVLPNSEAYAETCAAIGLALFARRMSAVCPDSKYADVAERAMYNGSISGVSLDGRAFFYMNPLEIDLEKRRVCEKWYYGNDTYKPITQRVELFGCSCCPPNIARFISSMGDFLYSYDDDTVYIHHYMQSEAEFDGIKIIQQTRYPNEGEVRITLSGMKGKKAAVRIPGWCSYVSLGGEKLATPVKKGYAYIDITEDSQTLDLWFEMKCVFIAANPKVAADNGKVCLCRGPVVYCAESVMNDNVNLRNISLDINGVTGLTFSDEIGMYIAETDAFEDAPSDSLYFNASQAEPVKRKIKMLPYFAYANHGESNMAVWLRKG